MGDKTKVLEIAELKCRESGAVDFKDFDELREGTGGFYLFQIKNILLDNGYECHEKRHIDEWWNLCSYQKRRTHFHRG